MRNIYTHTRAPRPAAPLQGAGAGRLGAVGTLVHSIPRGARRPGKGRGKPRKCPWARFPPPPPNPQEEKHTPTTTNPAQQHAPSPRRSAEPRARPAPPPRCLPRGDEVRAVPRWPKASGRRAVATPRPSPPPGPPSARPPRGRRAAEPRGVCACARAAPASPAPRFSPAARCAPGRAPAPTAHAPRRAAQGAHTDADSRRRGARPPRASRRRPAPAGTAAPAPGPPPPPPPPPAPPGSRAPLPLFSPLFA